MSYTHISSEASEAAIICPIFLQLVSYKICQLCIIFRILNVTKLIKLQIHSNLLKFCLFIFINKTLYNKQYSQKQKDKDKQSKMRTELDIIGLYKWDYKHFRVSLELASQIAGLSVTVLNTNNFDRFSMIIDQKYITLKEDFKNLFESPIELHDYLTNSISQISIDGDGELFRFQYEFTRSKKKSKFFEIKLEKSQLMPIQQANSRLNKLKKELQAMTKSNKLLQQKINETINQQNAQKNHFTAVNERINNHLKIATNQICVEKKRNFQLEVSIDYLKELISKQALQQFQWFSNMKIGNHPKNPHRYQFQQTCQDNQFTITCIGKQQQTTFLNSKPIFKQNCTYSMAVKGFKKSYVMVGFSTMNNLQLEKGFRSEQSVFYCSTGALIGNGSHQKLVPRLYENDSVKCTVDYLKLKVVWQINQRSSQETVIPSIACKEPLYLCIIFGNKGGSVIISE